tara:strand:+ start:138 stop:464 length:327 start_codon:yes stop_codon:yes gene_type:complete
MEKFLYFKDANDDAQLYPASSLIGIIHDADTTLKLRFKSAVTNSATATEIDLVTLTIDSNKEQEVCDAIVGALNAPGAHSSGMVVVADALAGVFIHPAITGTAATLDS